MKICSITLAVFIYFNVQGQSNLSGKYSREVMKKFCAVCQSKETLQPFQKASALNKYFHQAHTLTPVKNDKVSFTCIIKALELAGQEHRDSLFFF